MKFLSNSLFKRNYLSSHLQNLGRLDEAVTLTFERISIVPVVSPPPNWETTSVKICCSPDGMTKVSTKRSSPAWSLISTTASEAQRFRTARSVRHRLPWSPSMWATAGTQLVEAQTAPAESTRAKRRPADLFTLGILHSQISDDGRSTGILLPSSLALPRHRERS